MSTIYLLKYNNYYNRIVKKEDTLGAYLTQDCLLDTFENVNFVPADGVDTTLVVKHEGPNPDYLIVADGNDIESRWFVVESDIIRGGQYRLTLHRDVIVDSYDLVINAPCFIEKATLSNNDPFIFNGENMTFNQIKQAETPLKDETGCAWVVGYIPKDSFTGEASTRTVNTDFILADSADIVVENIDQWEYYPYITQKFNSYYTEEPIFIGRAAMMNGTVRMWNQFGSQGTSLELTSAIYNRFFELAGGVITTDLTINNMADVGVWGIDGTRAKAAQKWAGSARASLKSTLAKTLGLHTTAETSTFLGLNSKTIYDSAAKKYYRIRVEGSPARWTQNINSNMPALFNTMSNNLIRDCGNVEIGGATKNIQITGTAGATSFAAEASYYEYKVYLDQYTVSANVVISTPENRYHLEDQPYDMFCMPYSDSLKIYQNGVQLTTASSSLAINLATQIGASTGSGNVYDIQLLPYCPVRYCIMDDNTFDVKGSKFDLVKTSDGTTVGVLLWATKSSFTLNIYRNIASLNPKIENLVDKWRLCSPNFNGQFEFSPAMNGGVDYFNVDCTYKPFNPYIHVNPNFKKLYGKDFNDARGLICGGDFSLPQVSNAWADYQLNNKNYENIFNREIQNLQVQQKAQRIGDIASAVAGIGGGAAAGGLALGTGGAITGAAGSAIAGAADIVIGDKLRAEAMDYKRDMFGMQMGNIQALPTNITKTTAFTYNNKLFPILEYYTCTIEERNALLDKLRYNGMTVGRIGKIADYLANASDQYIKGRIIRIEGVSDDFHYYKAISDEIYKGAFF